ncbi:MAG: type IV toxin-antitoxin system AbiEi family antitoxin domain-containing protein [Betaproteobacteria bacterium]|nr:type IV toxin-antitoxin system AbiEi family antitoxin domain-containing protein [Betaproteobacteria bacterium]
MLSRQSHTERLLQLALRKGLLRPSDLAELGIPRVYLTRLVAGGKLAKAGRGLYRLAETPFSESESLAIVAARAPQAVFCLLTALQFHGLTTQLPRQVWIALPQGSRAPRMEYPPVKLIQYSGDAFTQGIETHRIDQVDLRVYSVAKTVADCFKHRNKIGLDVALEALRDARSRKKASADDLWRFAKICRVANVMRPYLEAVE